jgi:hypothetical protein
VHNDSGIGSMKIEDALASYAVLDGESIERMRDRVNDRPARVDREHDRASEHPLTRNERLKVTLLRAHGGCLGCRTDEGRGYLR